MPTGRLAHRLSRRLNPMSGQINEAYADELVLLGDLLEAGQGAVVYFTPETPSYVPPPSHLAAYWDGCRVDTAPEGFIYPLCSPSVWIN